MSDTVGTEGVRDTQTGEGASGGATTQVLDALPHPVILVDDKGCIAEANMAAESFFRASAPVMRRHPVSHFVPFGSPLLLLVQQVRERGAPVNEYKVDISSPRIGAEKIVDILNCRTAQRCST